MFQTQRLLTLLYIPYPDCLVYQTRCEALPVRGESDGSHFSGMTFKGEKLDDIVTRLQRSVMARTSCY